MKGLPVLLLVLAMLVAFTGIGLAVTKSVKATSTNRWQPKHQYVQKDGKIKWVNNTNRFHNIKSTNIRKNWSYSRSLPAGSTRTRTFHKRGTYAYRCTIHSQLSNGACSGMCGFIHVL
jgi:plastocyanin